MREICGLLGRCEKLKIFAAAKSLNRFARRVQQPVLPSAMGLAACLFFMQRALATLPALPVPHINRDDQHYLLGRAPFHVQARIIIPPHVSDTSADCTVEAVVIYAFKGAASLRAAAYVRLNFPCFQGQPSRTGGEYVGTFHPDPWLERRELKTGAVFEAFLRHYGPSDGYRLAGLETQMTDAPEERFRFLPKASSTPRISLPPLPKDYVYSPPKPSSLDWTAHFYRPDPDPADAFPPRFPKKDVTVIYETAAHPGHIFSTYYQAATWRTRTQQVGPGASSNYRLTDWLAGYSVLVSDKEREYVAVDDWLGMLPIDSLDHVVDEGSDVVAGLSCRTYYFGRIPEQTDIFHRVCITSDGVVLRKEGFLVDKTVARRVVYGSMRNTSLRIPFEYDRVTSSENPSVGRQGSEGFELPTRRVPGDSGPQH